MTELRNLVKRYVDEDIDYAEFRRLFVPYAACPNSDPIVEAAVNGIEMACADFVEGLIPDAQLKQALQGLTPELRTGARTVQFRFFGYRPQREQTVTSGTSSNLAGPGITQEQPETELLMEFASR